MEGPVQDWKYVAEGGANLVVAYVGPSPRFRDQVLRIRKRAHETAALEDAVLAEEDASVAFTDTVIIPLLPPNATPKLVSLRVSQSWLQALSDHIEPARPPVRKAVDKIDTERAYVVLAQNLVGTSSDEYEQVSIEIKPKWGFLPQSEYLSENSKAIKTQHCRFCLHRLYRSENGGADYSQASQYCPLDLYSHDEARVQKAVMSLVQSWASSGGKGNNMKLFVEGQMAFPDKIPHNDLIGITLGEIEARVTKLLSGFLAGSAVLRRLQHLQSRLDTLDIEGLCAILQKRNGVDILTMSQAEMEKLGGEIPIAEYSDFVQRYLQPSGAIIDIKDTVSTRDPIMAHLLSATFKDCSIFVQIRRPRKTTGAQQLDIQAFLVDCDVKSISRLRKYAKMDMELVDNYRTFASSGGDVGFCTE